MPNTIPATNKPMSFMAIRKQFSFDQQLTTAMVHTGVGGGEAAPEPAQQASRGHWDVWHAAWLLQAVLGTWRRTGMHRDALHLSRDWAR